MRPVLTLLALALLVCPAWGQDARKIPISFLPPPLETATYSLGIYDTKNGKLVRHLQEAATESAFTIGLNGLITNWDGKDDAGKAVPPGKYAALGYAVGALKVEGVNILGNDWTADDENLRIRRVEAVAALDDGTGLGLLAEVVSGPPQVACYEDAKNGLRWHKPLPANLVPDHPTGSLMAEGDALVATEGDVDSFYRVEDGAQHVSLKVPAHSPNLSIGKDDTTWKIDGDTLVQEARDGQRLRQLAPKPGEPIPVAVSASDHSDRIYLLEEMPGWQRVRGLSWVETAAENGKQISKWQTFFERSIRQPDPVLGLDKPALSVEISLVENPLDPGKPQKVKLDASFDDQGSYLTTADGLRLRRISQRANLVAVRLAKGKVASSLTLFQNDGAAWDEFSIEGVRNMMAFDAGEIDMTADGEKTHPEKAAEPPDL